jgi:single-stranded-DNA-specific exonuclease
LDRFGGHAQAAGMDVTAIQLPAFRAAFEAEARRRLEGHDLCPRLRIDLELPEEPVDMRLLELFQYCGPHGIGNPRPVFLLRGAEAFAAKEVGQGHLRVGLRKGAVRLQGIGFGLASRHRPSSLGDQLIDVVFQLVIDRWKGVPRVQARVLDLRPAESG